MDSAFLDYWGNDTGCSIKPKPSRGVPIEKRDVDVSKHASWPIRGMLLLYGITISATMVAVLIGAVSLRIAVPGLVVNLALITLLSWIDRSKTTRIR